MLSNLLESPPITPVWRCSKMLLRKYNPCLLKRGFSTKRSQPVILALVSHIPISPTVSVPQGLFPLSTGLRSTPCPIQEASLQAPGPQPQQSPDNPPFFKAQFRFPSSILFFFLYEMVLPSSILPFFLYEIYTFTIIFIILYWLCFHNCSHFGINVLLLCVSSVPKIL